MMKMETLNDANRQLIEATTEFVKNQLRDAEGGHDWWHIYRVWKLAKTIGKAEGADGLVVELGALLHDIADAKFNGGDETLGPEMTRQFLVDQGVDRKVIDQVEAIVRDISFKNTFGREVQRTLELDVVQDADRLDAMGAIGIARAFNYGGYQGNVMYDPQLPPRVNMTKEEYKKGKSTTINHFYEKLLLLKDKMNTDTGKRLAEARHQYMLTFLDTFYREWEGGNSVVF
ncbi:MAG: HD domain-containing protein [Bacteroidales bacterium]|nr:HD domain-containing protein [Bacteroidales bacterium]